MKRLLVLFDVDGTLIHSGGCGRRAILAALADELGGDPGSLEQVRFDGKTDPQIVLELLAAAGEGPADPPRIDRVLERYLAHLRIDLAAHGHLASLHPGIGELLDLLEGNTAIVLGLLTGNVTSGAEMKLRAAGLEPRRFRVGAFGSDHAVRSSLPPIAAARAAPLFGRPPSGREVVIIGDTPADVTCGLGIGARSIGVATGGYSASALRAAGADLVFEHFGDVARAGAAILDGMP